MKVYRLRLLIHIFSTNCISDPYKFIKVCIHKWFKIKIIVGLAIIGLDDRHHGCVIGKLTCLKYQRMLVGHCAEQEYEIILIGDRIVR